MRQVSAHRARPLSETAPLVGLNSADTLIHHASTGRCLLWQSTHARSLSLSLPLSLPHSPVAPLADNYEDITRTGEQGQTGHESLHAGMIIGATEGLAFCIAVAAVTT